MRGSTTVNTFRSAVTPVAVRESDAALARLSCAELRCTSIVIVEPVCGCSELAVHRRRWQIQADKFLF